MYLILVIVAALAALGFAAYNFFFVKKLDEGMKGTMADYQIGMVSETPLMDVYPYSAGPNDKPEFDPSKA